ncbi:hypothetical protein [Psychromonas sp. KJ10-2]
MIAGPECFSYFIGISQNKCRAYRWFIYRFIISLGISGTGVAMFTTAL